jgi:hypothetical protein
MKKRVAEPPVSNTVDSNSRTQNPAASDAPTAIYRVQPPSTLNDVANQLANDLKYQPSAGETKCNIFLSDFTVEAFNYSGLVKSGQEISANAIINLMRTGRDNWKVIYDTRRPYLSTDLGDLQISFDRAIKLSTQGYLVVYGLQLDPHGHVAVGVIGNAVQSAKWTSAGLPGIVPLVAQAGETVFAARGISYGLGPKNFKRGQFVICVRNEDSLD